MILSADSHICEPPDLWTRRLPARFQDRAPRTMRDVGGKQGEFFVCEGAAPRSVFAAFGAGTPVEQLSMNGIKGFDAAPASVWSPAARIADQDVDGVAGEVLYPTMADLIFGCRDAELRRACFAAYNDFVAEYCAHDPARLAGVALLDLEDMSLVPAELERARRMGMRGVVLRADPPADQGYHLRAYDELWAMAEEAGLPVSIHRGAIRRDIASEVHGPLVDYVMIPGQIQRALASMLLGGVWERFPRLRLVCCEFDISWLPHFLARIDHAYQRYGRAFGLSLSRLPSEQIRQSVLFTFQEETDALSYVSSAVGFDSLMWASDFPHADSTWPNSRAVVAHIGSVVSAADASRLLASNCARLFGFAH